MDLASLLAVLEARGLDAASTELAAARAAAPGDAALERLARVFDREAAALASWRPAEEPAFALQQLRNQAARSGLRCVAQLAEAALGARGGLWLAEVGPSRSDEAPLLRAFAGGAPGRAALLGPDGATTRTLGPGGVEVRSVESGALVATWPLGGGKVVEGPDEQLLADTGGRGAFRLVDVATGRLLFEEHRERKPSLVARSRDGRWLVLGESESTGFDGEYYSSFKLTVWDLSGREVRWRASGSEGHAGGLSALALSPDGSSVAAVACSQLRLWRLADGAVLGEWPTAAFGSFALAFTADGRRLVTNERTSLGVLDLPSGTSRALPTGEGYVEAVATSPDGMRAAAAGSGHLTVFELASGRQLWRRKLASGSVNGLWFASASGPLVAASGPGTIEVVDASGGGAPRSFTAHASSVLAAAATPDGRHLVTATATETKVWDLAALDGGGDEAGAYEAGAARSLLEAPPTHRPLVTPDGGHVVLQAPPSLRMLRLGSEGPAPEFREELPGLTAAALSADGAWLFAAARDGTLRRVALAGRELAGPSLAVRALAEHPGLLGKSPALLLPSPDGARLLTCPGRGATLEVWDLDPGPDLVAAGSSPWRIECGGEAKDVAFSRDGRLLVAAHEGVVRVLDVAARTVLAQLRCWAERVAVDADGLVVAAVRHLGTEVWSLATRAKVGGGRAAGYNGALLDGDGRWALTETGRGRLTVEERRPGRAELVKVCEVTGTVPAASLGSTRLGAVFCADGGSVVTATPEGGLALWRLDTGRPLARLRSSHPFVQAAASRDRRRLAATDSAGRVHVLELRGTLEG